MKLDVLGYKCYQILDEQKNIHQTGLPSLKEAQNQLSLMARFIEKRDKVTIEVIDTDHIVINGTLYYIFDATQRVQY